MDGRQTRLRPCSECTYVVLEAVVTALSNGFARGSTKNLVYR